MHFNKMARLWCAWESEESRNIKGIVEMDSILPIYIVIMVCATIMWCGVVETEHNEVVES